MVFQSRPRFVIAQLPSTRLFIYHQMVSTASFHCPSQANSSFAIHAQTNFLITVHSHSLQPPAPQTSFSHTSLLTATSADANRSAHHLFHPLTSAPDNQDHVCRAQRETTHLRSCQPRRGLTTSLTANEYLWICVARRRWHSAVSTCIRCRPSCALPATTSMCRRSGREACWRPLRNSLHAQGRRVLARRNDTQSH